MIRIGDESEFFVKSVSPPLLGSLVVAEGAIRNFWKSHILTNCNADLYWQIASIHYMWGLTDGDPLPPCGRSHDHIAIQSDGRTLKSRVRIGNGCAVRPIALHGWFRVLK